MAYDCHVVSRIYRSLLKTPIPSKTGAVELHAVREKEESTERETF